MYLRHSIKSTDFWALFWRSRGQANFSDTTFSGSSTELVLTDNFRVRKSACTSEMYSRDWPSVISPCGICTDIMGDNEVSPQMKKTRARISCNIFLFAVVALVGIAPARVYANPPTDSPAAARMRALNNSLMTLHGRMQQADANSARTLHRQATAVIAERATTLANLIQNDPHAALTFAFSSELLSDLSAKFPESATQLESHTTVTGPAQHWIADYQKSSRSWWSMNSGGRSVNLFFAGPEPRSLNPNEVLQASGVMTGRQMAVETSNIIQSGSTASLGADSDRFLPSQKKPVPNWPATAVIVLGFVFAFPGSRRTIRFSRAQMLSFLKQSAIYGLVFALCITSSQGYAQNSCTTTGVQNVIVILATFPGVTLPANVTPQSVSEMFFGSSAPSLTTYWQEASYGATSATGDVFGWFTLTGNYSSTACQSLPAVQTDAMAAAAAAGANFQNYTRVVVVFPDVLGCGWSGLSNIGCFALSTPSGTINASSSYLTAGSAVAEVAAHELGHGLGLDHASTRGFTDNTGTAITLGPLGVTGTLTEYGDKFSTMGCCDLAEYGAPHKAKILNWLAPNVGYQTVQTSGTFVIQPYETPGGLKAIRVQRGTGNNAWLWIEYRQPDGSYDPSSFPSPQWSTAAPQPYSGALIHYEDSVSGLHTHLINYTPADSSFYSPALVVGQTWADPYSNLSLSVVSATSTGLTVNVSYGSVPCTPANPTVTASPLDPTIYPGNEAAYNVSITNNDSAGCSPNTYTVTSTQPSNWPTTFSGTSVTISPGGAGSLTMYKTGPSGTSPGTYIVNASAGNSSYVGSSTANVTVMSAPSLTVSVSVPTPVALRSTVPITAVVLNGGIPAPGASVTFTLSSPSGPATTQTATASSSGTATWSYKLGPRSAIGTYTVTAQATLTSGSRKATTSQSAGSNTVNFTVQ